MGYNTGGMRNYEIQSEILSFGNGVQAFEARKQDDGSRAIVVRFPKTESAVRVFSQAERLAMSLRAERQLLPIVDVFADDENSGALCAAYQWDPSLIPLADINPEVRGAWIMRDSARILESFYLRQLSGQFLGEQAIFVDEKTYSIRLAFVGLADAFRACGAGPWHQDVTPNHMDDMHHLAGCFETEIQDAPDTVRACLADKKEERPRYPQLLREMSASPLFHPRYAEEVALMSKHADADELVEHLNTTDCYLSPWREEERKDKLQRQCEFRTGKFAGKFVSGADDRHFFIPLLRRSTETPKGEILRARFRLTANFPEREKGYHHLTALSGQKTETIEKWRVVPEQEKEFIEETAFNARYCNVREMPGSVRKFSFLLSQGEDVDWQQVQALKERQKQLDAVPMSARIKPNSPNGMSVGKIDNITEGRLVIGVTIDKGSPSPEAKGGLLIGGSSGVAFPYVSRWRNGGVLSFVAADSGTEDLHNQIKEMLVQTPPPDVSFSGEFAPFGHLHEAAVLPEIVTRDPDAKFEKIPRNGSLLEDVFLETLPFKRQIEAVDLFERGDIVEPALGGVLATPEEHKPLIVTERKKVFWRDTPDNDTESDSDEEGPGAESGHYWINEEPAPPALFDKKLNSSQKSAVTRALLQKPLFLVQGPPGTGKTTVIIEIIRQILAANSRARILVCSQTNLAVDNVFERLPPKREKGHAPVRKVRLASDFSSNRIHSKIRPDLVRNKIHSWSKDAINRSKMAQQNAPQKDGASPRERAVARVVKKWQAMLRNPTGKNCQIRGNAEGGWMPMETAFLKSMNVLGATCVHIASSAYRDIFSDTFDHLIIDEAGKATPAESLIPIARAKHIILIGDHKQLPPFVTRENAVRDKVREKMEDEGIEDLSKEFGESLFESLISAKQMEACRVMLNTQRRMPKQIGDLVSKYFYQGELKSPHDEEYARKKRLGLPLKNNTSLVFIDTAGRNNPHDNERVTARQNSCNTDVVVETLHCLDNRLKKEGIDKVDAAVIAGYKGQVELLKKRVKREHFSSLTVDVNTVDGFQGRENTVVIYDTVRSSRGRASIGFLDDPRRLNVALSRAQKLLIIIGNADYLVNRAEPMRKLNPKKDAKLPILGEITEEIMKQDGVFKSLEEALE